MMEQVSIDCILFDLNLYGFSEDPCMVCREQVEGDLELFLKELEK